MPIKEFLLSQIAKLHYGNKFDKNKMTYARPDVNFVSRTAANNGISDVVDRIDGVTPYPAGCVSLAFGGSIGSCFLQDKPFYTGQNVGVIEFSPDVPHEAKLYFVTALEKVCKAKYVTFSDEINKHFKTDLAVSLPVTTVAMPDWAALETLLKVHGGGVEMSKIDTSSWKKFKISELFMAQTGNVDIQKVHINGKGVSVVSSGVEGNGIIGKTDMNAKVFPAGTLTVDMFGNTFYRDFEYKMVTHARVFSLSLKDDTVAMLPEVGLFLEASLKFLTQMYSFNNMCTFDKISDLEISLPVTTQDVPDWDYMQERIAELEQERIAELEQYLVATGLNDYTLTDDDLKTLSLSGSRHDKAGDCPADAGVRKEMREFRMGDLFEFKAIKQAQSQSLIPTDASGVQYVVQSTRNNMVARTVDKQWLVDHNEAPVPGNALVLGVTLPAVSYQPYEFGASQVIVARSTCLNEENGVYLASILDKQMSRFSYTKKPGMAIYKAMEILLPVQTDTTGCPVIDEAKAYHPEGYVPDWDYMAAYIRAIEKLVIKDVVDYKNEFIATHRAVVAESGVLA